MSIMKRVAAAASVALAMAMGATAVAAPAQAAPSSGWNDWSCQPSAAHPEPVVLLHGLGGQGTSNWFFHAPQLAGAGYCVFSTTYGEGLFGEFVGGLGSMRTSAVEVGEFVDRVLEETGAAEVDLVGHSEGTTVAAYYLKLEGGADKVKRFVGFGTNLDGTSLNGLRLLIDLVVPVLPAFADLVASQCAACFEFLPPNDFLTDLNAGGNTVAGVDYTSIMSRYDTVVTPYTSGEFDGSEARNIVLQEACPHDASGHVAMATDPNVNLLIRRALDPANPPALRCAWVFPSPF